MPQPDPVPTPEKIAILGGGLGGVATALELSNSDRAYDITIYQMGWRLGGKGATGRNLAPHYHGRIEEHGMHVWSGIYENAFRLIRDVYRELERDPDHPLASWERAFKPQNHVVLEEEYKGRWHHWRFILSEPPSLPGEPDAALPESPRSGIELLVQALLARLHSSPDILSSIKTLSLALPRMQEERPDPSSVTHTIDFSSPEKLVHSLAPSGALGVLLDTLLGSLERDPTLAARLLQGRQPVMQLLAGPTPESVLGVFSALASEFWLKVKPHMDSLPHRMLWITTNFIYGNIRGVIEDRVLERGFDVLDDQDYREWLEPFLIDDGRLTIDSPLPRFLYDADFAYVDGDFDKPDLSATVVLYTLSRLAFTARGAYFWEMQAGMGETVFTPFYRLLRQRGVKFKFFHRIKQLHVSEDGRSISGITLGRQAKLRKGVDEYEPLVTVKDVECWPSRPLFDQLADGESLAECGKDFEAWCDTEGEVEQVLEVERDFHRVVLAIPVGVHAYIAGELIRAQTKWRDMVNHLKTVRTMALQLWLKPPLAELGWAHGDGPLIGPYSVSPLSMYADTSYTLLREDWPGHGDDRPANVAYFWGIMSDDVPPAGEDGPVQPCSELSQAAANAKVARVAAAFLSQHVRHLWPKTAPRGRATGFRWDFLIDKRPDAPVSVLEDEERLGGQFTQGNVQPSARYVQSVHGSGRYRLDPGDSGFSNLYLAGDWTRNGFNVGSVEAAAISALLASHAISGRPDRDHIPGLDFGHSPDPIPALRKAAK